MVNRVEVSLRKGNEDLLKWVDDPFNRWSDLIYGAGGTFKKQISQQFKIHKKISGFLPF